jgi:XPG I-region
LQWFMQALKEVDVQFIVAPYEADAQMAYLAKANLADIIITEDSDLLAYGCPEVSTARRSLASCRHAGIDAPPLHVSTRGSSRHHAHSVSCAAPRS